MPGEEDRISRGKMLSENGLVGDWGELAMGVEGMVLMGVFDGEVNGISGADELFSDGIEERGSNLMVPSS